MIDHWLGRIIDVVDRHDAWDTTAFILCTDHGHYLGEHGGCGASRRCPCTRSSGTSRCSSRGRAWRPRTCDALTTTVDLHATLCDAFGVTPEHRTHGHSLVPLLEGTATAVREWALCGVWGREVHVADATRTFAKAPGRDATVRCRCSPTGGRRCRSAPCPIGGSRSPITAPGLDRSPGSDVPVIRQPFDPSDDLPFWAVGGFNGDLLYDRLEADATGECGTWAERAVDGR